MYVPFFPFEINRISLYFRSYEKAPPLAGFIAILIAQKGLPYNLNPIIVLYQREVFVGLFYRGVLGEDVEDGARGLVYLRFPCHAE